jgi:uncharacterized repeat protein (TIGR01451 family)
VSAANATVTSVNPQNGYNGDNIDLSATLTDTDNANAPIVGKTISFSVDGSSVGTAVTDSDGKATYQNYHINKIAGTYPILASFAGDSDFQASSGTNNLRVDASAPITITLTNNATLNRANAGEIVRYTVTMKNNGLDPATNVQLIANIPTGLAWWSNSGTGSWVGATRTITWDIGTIAPGATSTQTFDVQVLAIAKGLNKVTTVTETHDEFPNYAGTSKTITVNKSPVTVTITNNVKDNVNPGDNVVFTATLTNNGPDPAKNVFFKIMSLSCGFGYVSSDGTYTSGIRSISWNIGTIAPGQTVTVTFTLKALATYAGKDVTVTGSQKNDAEVLSQGTNTVHINKL